MSSSYTITYKRVGDLDIKIDVTIPSFATADSLLPALVYFHGGGLLSGGRTKEDAFFPFWAEGTLSTSFLCGHSRCTGPLFQSRRYGEDLYLYRRIIDSHRHSRHSTSSTM